MALRKNNIAIAAIASMALFSLAVPALAQNFDDLSRSDFISLSAGDAARSNIAIQHPTPWPSYVNDTKIRTPARQGVSALENMFKRYEGDSSADPTTVINIGK